MDVKNKIYRYDRTLIKSEMNLLSEAETFKANSPIQKGKLYSFLGYVFTATNETPTNIAPILNTVNFTMSLPSAIRRTCELLMLEEIEICFDGKLIRIGYTDKTNQFTCLVYGSKTWCRSNTDRLSSDFMKIILFSLSSHLHRK